MLLATATIAPVSAFGPPVPPAKRRFTPGTWSYFCYASAASYTGDQPYGYYSDLCWKQNTISASKPATTKGWLLMLKWSHVEKAPGVYDWTALDTNITAAAKLGLDVRYARGREGRPGDA